MLWISFAGGTVLLNFIPYSVNKSNFILNKVLISKRAHQLANLSITSHCEDSWPLTNLVLALAKVVVKLFYKFLTFLQCFKMALSSWVSLIFQHFTPFVAASHSHLKSSSLDLCLIQQTSLFIDSKNRLTINFLILKSLKLRLNYLKIKICVFLPPAIF